MAGTVVMIGTRKGVWIATGDERARQLGPARSRRAAQRGPCRRGGPVGGRRRDPADVHGQQALALGSAGAPLRRPRPHLGQGPRRRDRLPRGHRPHAGGGLGDRPVAVRPGRGLGRHRALGAVPLHRRRPDLLDGPLAVGPPAPRAVGRRLRRAGHPHRAAAPDRPAAGDRRDVDRRRLPHLRRRRLLGAGQPGHPGGLPARGRAVPRVRPVRAQGHPRPAGPRPALPAEPRRRLPQRRRRRTPGPRSPRGCPATSASPS